MSRGTLPWQRRWSGRSIASATVLSVVSAALVVAAIRSDGYHATKINLDDASVWVFHDGVSADKGYVARLNSQTRELDTAISYQGLDQADIWQLGPEVTLGFPSGTAKLDPVRAEIPPRQNEEASGKLLDSRAGVSVVLDRGEHHAAWVGQDLDLATFHADPELAELTGLTSQAVAAVSADGDVLIADPESHQYWVARLDDRNVPHLSGRRSLNLGFKIPEGASFTAVGEVPVFLYADAAGTSLAWPGRDTPIVLPDHGALLQQPGPRAGEVLVAGELGLWSVSLGDGRITQLAEGSSHPAAPVLLRGCIHAAWAGDQRYVQKCGDSPAKQFSLGEGGIGPAERLVFRVNGRIIALNGEDGRVFLVNLDEAPTVVNNWDEVIQREQQDTETTNPNPEPAECDTTTQKDPLPPKAPDVYGVHPGETVRMPVLDSVRDAN
jgi:hypothetical protein